MSDLSLKPYSDDEIKSKIELSNVSSQRIIVAGFFDRKNLGDDLFKHVWTHIFKLEKLKDHNVRFVGLDDLRLCQELTTCDVLIFAGGDVLNYYFLSNLKDTLHKYRFSGKLYAFSVGIPYQVVIVDGLLDQFNFVMCRAKVDAFSLRRRFGDNHVRYFPDLSTYLPELFKVEKPKREGSGINKYKMFHQRLNVGVFLTRNIFSKNAHYETVVRKLADFLDVVAESTMPGMCGFEIFLIPFNTNENNIFENDMLINRDVVKHVRNKEAIHDVSDQLSVEEMWWIFKNQLDVNITMRYHSHMYSIMSNVPFVSLHTTRKVQNLLFDSNLSSYSYQFPLNEDDVPTDLDVDVAFDKFKMAFNDRHNIRNNMKIYVEKYASLEQFEDTLTTLIEDPLEKVRVRRRIYPVSTILDVIESLVKYIWTEQNNSYNDADVALIADEIYKGKISFVALMNDHKDWQSRNPKLPDFLASLACFRLIHIPYPKYHYGMSQKILNRNFHAKNEFMWVWTDYQKNNEKFFLNNPIMRKPYFNATFVGIEDFKGCHRSGWQHVLDNLMSYHSDTSPLIFDNYIDRTFHWAHDVYKYTRIIPFKKPWCGFVHHTFDETYSPYNVPNLFRNPTFVDSLDNCFALFTLSQDLAVKIKVLLQQSGHHDVHVKSFVHPTEMPRIVFSIDRFLENEQRKVVQIGAWLRDSYAIYRLTPHKNRKFPYETERVPLKKAILRGKHMSNYFKPDNFFLVFDSTEYDGNSYKYMFERSPSPEPFSDNKFVMGLADRIHEDWNSVEVIDTLNNDDYDDLLSENIVFLKLRDASAVNTVIECVVRCTPLLVNRLAAVEEMLGADYPFFYDTMTEANIKVNDIDLIKKTNKYMSLMNKDRFGMEHFMQDVNTWFKEHPLNDQQTNPVANS